MNTKECMGLLAAQTIGVGALNSALCTASGWAGAATLAANYPGLGYNIDDAITIGAVGGAVVGAGASALGSCCYKFFDSSENNPSLVGAVSSHALSMMLSALAGYGILKSAGVDLEMDINDTMLAFLIGGAETAISLATALGCIFMCCLMICDDEPREEESDGNMPASLAANRPYSTV